MKNDILNLGFLTTLSGRWPTELPEKRQAQYGAFLRENISGAEIITPGHIVSTVSQLEEAADLFKKSAADAVIMLYGAFTGDDFPTILAERVGTDVPIILWAPYEPPFDGGRLTSNALVAATMNSASLKRVGHICYVVYGGCEDEKAVKRLTDILSGYRTVKRVRGTTFGLFGYRPTAFYNSAFDEGLIRRTFGIRMEETDLKVVFDRMEGYSSEKIAPVMDEVSKNYESLNLPDGHLENHARLYLALEELMSTQGYDYAAIKCWPEMGQLKTTPCAVLGRLADKGRHIGCEGDVDATLALIFQNALTDLPAFITDMINIDETENTLTFWHCGNPAPSLFGEKPVISNHPLAGQGTAFYGALKTGKVTVARMCNIGGAYKLFVTRGEAVPTVRNTKGAMVNVKIDMPVRDYIYKIIEEGVPHHYSIVWEDVADQMIFAAKLLGIETFKETV